MQANAARRECSRSKPEKLAGHDLILHVDVDAFFASVEQLLIPALRSRPVMVGSGVIASCSYEARRFGLRAGMPLARAKRLCPQAVLRRGDYQVYRCFAEHVWEVCRRFTCGLETYLDEAYGDAGGMRRLHGDPLALGVKLQRQVRREVGLPVTVGLGGNRMLAKVASAAGKPGGVVWIAPAEARERLAPLAVEELPGVGPRTAQKLRDMNVRTVGELQALPPALLRDMLGRNGERIAERARGRDPQPLRPNAPPRTISRETTFHKPTCDPHEIRAMLFYLLERAMRAARELHLLPGRVELSVRYDDGKSYAAARTLPGPTGDDDEAFAVVLELLERLHSRRVAVRHTGIVLSRFTPQAAGGQLFTPPERQRASELYQTLDAIRDRWGHAAVISGKSVELLGKLQRNDYGFVLRTPSLTK